MEFVLVQIDQVSGQLMYLEEVLENTQERVQRWTTDAGRAISFETFGDAKCLACYLSSPDGVVLVKEIADIG
jgi:hypothetical protein